MGRFKKRLSSVLAILLIAMTFSSNLPVDAAETTPMVTFVGVEHSPLVVGDTETFYLSSKGTEKVQYRVFQNKVGTDKWEELTKGYTVAESANAITTVNGSAKYEIGKYKISVWVKKADTEGKLKNKNGSYDSYYVANLNCVSKDNNNRVYTSGDMNVEKDNYIVGETVKIDGIKGISGMKAPYTYKVHVYDVSNNVWYLDKADYRDKENLTWIAGKPGTYVLDVWAMSSNSTLWAKSAKLNGRIYEGWKLKVITVKEKEITPPVIPVPEPIYNVTNVSLNKTTANLTIAETLELTATINPSNATNKKVTWTSSNEAVATVEVSTEAKAKVTAKTPGIATISVITEDGRKIATCAVTVVPTPSIPPTPPTPPTPPITYNVISVSLDEATANLLVKESFELTAKINPDNATNKKVTWKSSNESIATVTGNIGTKANVIGLAEGTATITVTTEDGQKTATCEVIVTAAPTPGTELNATVVVAEDRVTVSVDNIKVANQAITITMKDKKDDKLVFIDQVTANSDGKCTFNTSLDAGKYYGFVRASEASLITRLDFEVVHTSIRVSTVTLNNTVANVTTGQSIELIATINPSDAANKNITWTSSNEAIAKVTASAEGTAMVTALSAGTAIITVTTEDGQKTATCIVTVVDAPIPDTELKAIVVVEEKIVTVSVDNIKVSNQQITITMHNKENDTLVFIDQLKADVAGKVTFKTSLEAGKCYGVVKAAEAYLFTNLDFEVVNKVESVNLDKTDINTTTGQSIELTATINPGDATNKNVTWTSSDESVATVTFTALKAIVTTVTTGSAIIFVTTEDGGHKAACKITVVSTELGANVKILGNKVDVSVNNSKIANQQVTITMNNKENGNLVFIDQLKADVAGIVTFNTSLEAGKYRGLMKASEDNLYTRLDFEVIINVESVSIDKIEINTTTGQSIELTAIINPSKVTNPSLTWTSSDESVATVTFTGTKAIVTTMSTGSTIIFVTTADGGFTASCKIIVTATTSSAIKLDVSESIKDIKLDAATFDKTDAMLTIGELLELIARINSSDEINKKIAWISRNQA